MTQNSFTKFRKTRFGLPRMNSVFGSMLFGGFALSLMSFTGIRNTSAPAPGKDKKVIAKPKAGPKE
ncbi:MAG TPA: hypothetical protein VGB84_02650, partial [Arachidicoccus sp.]